MNKFLKDKFLKVLTVSVLGVILYFTINFIGGCLWYFAIIFGG